MVGVRLVKSLPRPTLRRLSSPEELPVFTEPVVSPLFASRTKYAEGFAFLVYLTIFFQRLER